MLKIDIYTVLVCTLKHANENRKHFTLKNIDKRVTTQKSLPLKKGTIRNKLKIVENTNVDSDEDNG